MQDPVWSSACAGTGLDVFRSDMDGFVLMRTAISQVSVPSSIATQILDIVGIGDDSVLR